MKKILIIVLLVIGAGVTGVFVFSSKSKQGKEVIDSTRTTEESAPTENQKMEEQTKAEELKNEAQEQETVSPDSLSLGGSYRCTYTLEEGFKVTTYIKNGKMRTEMPLEDGDTNISLYMNEKVYQWSEKEKQGIFMSVEEAKNSRGQKFRLRMNILMRLKTNTALIVRIWI